MCIVNEKPSTRGVKSSHFIMFEEKQRERENESHKRGEDTSYLIGCK